MKQYQYNHIFMAIGVLLIAVAFILFIISFPVSAISINEIKNQPINIFNNYTTVYVNSSNVTYANQSNSLIANAGESIPVILGDNLGATNISIRNYSGGQVASIDSIGNTAISNTLKIKSSVAETNFNGWILNFTRPDISYIQASALSAGSIVFQTGGANNRMRITSNGLVGVNTVSPTTNFHVAGNARISGLGAGTVNSDAGGNLTSVSDEKFKTNLHSLKESTKGPALSALQKILALNPLCGNYNAASGLDTQNTYCWIGTAQDIEKVIPEAVYTKHDVKYETVKSADKNGEETVSTIEIPLGTDTKFVDDRVILGETILAIQEQQATIDAQQKQIDELKTRLDKAGIKP